MKYKREPRSPPSKSKSSKLDRMKIKKILKQHGISSEEAKSILDSSLVSRGKYRDRRRSDSASGSSKIHERQLNGKKYIKSRSEKKRKKKKSHRSRETSPKISKMYNGYRKHESFSHSSKKKKNAGRHRKIEKPSKLIRKVMESRDGNSHLNSVDKHRNDSTKKATKRKYDDSSSSSSEEKYVPSKRYKYYSDSLAEYLLTNYSSSSSGSEDDSEDDAERSVEPEAECNSTIVLDSDDSADENVQPNIEATRTTPTPTPIINDHHTRVKKAKKMRSPKVSKKIGPLNMHPNQSNDRVDSHTSDDGSSKSSESSFESDDSSESPASPESKDNYVYVTKGRRRRKLRPPNMLRKNNSTNGQRIRSNERNKTKQNALKFVVTEVEPNEHTTNGNQTMSPEKRKSPEQRKSPVSLSPKERKERENARRLALVKYYPRSHRNDERYENDANESNLRSPSYEGEGDWSNLSEEDYFSDFKNDERNLDDRNGDLTDFIDTGKSRKSYDLRGFTIDFNSDNDIAQVFEIEVPVSTNECQPIESSPPPHPTPPHLIVEAEETVDYMEDHNENSHEYQDNCDVGDSPIERFPIKIVDTNSLNCLSSAEIKLNMSNREIDTTSVMITEAMEINESTEDPTETACHKNTESDGQAHKMDVNDLPTDSSSMSRDEENEESPDAESEDDFVDIQAHGTAPIFFNSTNSRQVLMLLKTKIYFNGALSIRLLAGQANIFGYELEQNETVIANSPRGHSFLYLSPSSKHHEHHNNENLEFYLKELSDTFMSSDLEQIRLHFNSSTDAIVLLERDSSNKGIFMIEKYMKQTIFPNVNAFNVGRTYHNTESILHCQFLRHTGTGLKIDSKWNDIGMTSTSRQIIIGGKGVGKSTLLRYLINTNVKEFKKILLVDLDIGQPELFLPQTVSATIITEPLLGPGYLRNQSPRKSYLFGDINVLVSPIKYLKCVLKLLKYCCSCEEFSTIPWVINTMGYNRGFGLELIVAILKALNPTDLIQIQARRSIDNFEMIFQSEEVNKFCFNIFKDEVQDMTNDCSYATHIYDTVSKGERKNAWNISPKDLRFAMILSKLGNIMQGNDNWITDVKPICASLNDLKIIVVSDDCLNANLQPNILNGNLVYLCQKTEDDSTDDNIVDCYGIGVVRAVELATNRVYLLPSIPRIELQLVNALAVCSIPLPTPIALTQNLRITGRVPYVYSSDNFVGSRQIVPISYRPDKRKFTNHTLN